MDFFINNDADFKKYIENVNPGDTLYVDSIECLGKSVYEVNSSLQEIHKKELYLNISNNIELNFYNNKNSMNTVILLDSICNIQKNRVRENVQKAIKNGKRIGRKKLSHDSLPDVFINNFGRYNSKELNKTEFAKLCKCSRPTLDKWIKCFQEK